MSRGLRDLGQWCRVHRHLPLKEQWHTLCQKVRGHHGYYGIAGNSHSVAAFTYWAARIWRKWLNRRGGKRLLNWARFYALLQRYPLPTSG